MRIERKRHDTVSSSPLPAAVSNDLNLIPPQYPLSPPKRSATLTSSSKMRRMDLEVSCRIKCTVHKLTYIKQE